jgi:hypothetical protein
MIKQWERKGKGSGSASAIANTPCKAGGGGGGGGVWMEDAMRPAGRPVPAFGCLRGARGRGWLAGWLAGWMLHLHLHLGNRFRCSHTRRLHCISSFLLALCRVTFSQDRIAPKKMRPFSFTRRLVNLCFFFSFFLAPCDHRLNWKIRHRGKNGDGFN